jgi:hypothetical protein
MKRFFFSITVLTAVATANACSSGSSTSGFSDDPDSGSGATLSFSTDVYSPIIEKHCIFCHGPTEDGGSGSGIQFGSVDMGTETSAYANLVGTSGGVAAGGAACSTKGSAGLKRVAPSDPTDSLLYNKISNNDGDGGTLPGILCGHAMPLGEPALSAADQTTIHDWIAQGANP